MTGARLPFEHSLAGKRVLVTGHTGFTGSWSCMWLKSIGADVAGCALEPDTEPSLFRELSLDRGMTSAVIDIREYQPLAAFFASFRPELVLHLAAQPLVRRGYREPMATFATNTQGTVHVLEAARNTNSVKAVVCVTTDKVYQNREWSWPYRENDTIGASEPYGGSKAAAEMAIAAYRVAFGSTDGSGCAFAAARGGNIIGGGDWAEDRLIPDFVRAVVTGGRLTLRNPDATRPWQHVLGLVQGYLMLLASLREHPAAFAGSWNFGAHETRSFTVREVLELLSSQWSRPDIEYVPSPLREAQMLALDSSEARSRLGWNPPWDTRRAIAETAAWYRDFYCNRSLAEEITVRQLESWRTDLHTLQQ